MKKVNAVTLRRSLGKILSALLKGGQPILIEWSRRPAAVLLSLDDYQKRFVDRTADEQRAELIHRIKATRARGERSTVDVLRRLRGSER